MMFGIENYMGFIFAAVLLNLTPGADTFYILTRSITAGRSAGLASAAGISTGCIVHILCAALGLSLILTTSAAVFFVVKWAGALYLIYLGIKAIIEKPASIKAAKTLNNTKDLLKIYKQGIFTNVLNPKVALFFLSFLPQFINPAYVKGPIPFLILGGTFLFTGTIWCFILVWMASRMTHILRKNSRIHLILQKISGMVFIGFGLKLALIKK